MISFLLKSSKVRSMFNWLIVITFFAIPYLIFGNNLFIGGDDTRLFYFYPSLWYNNISGANWFSLSTLGNYNPNNFLSPFLWLLIILEKFRLPFWFIQNSIFSFILIGSFYYLKNFLEELPFKKSEFASSFFALFFIFSPILGLTQFTTYLYPIWLLGWITAYLYYLTCYFKKPSNLILLKIFILSFFLSLAIFSIPWMLGVFLPLGIALLIYLILFKVNNLKYYIFKYLYFNFWILLSQVFWVIPFFLTFLSKDSYVGSSVLTEDVKKTFFTTVEATSRGNNIFYPLLNLFHYQIQVDFGWQSLALYSNYYLNYLIIALILPITVGLGVFFKSKYNVKKVSNIYHLFIIFFLISILFFTVNVPFFREFFILLGGIPGFVMFRNFFDKFPIGYVLSYAIILYISFVIIKDNLPKKILRVIQIILVLNLIIQAFPFLNGSLLNKPLWQTKDYKTAVTGIPDEYTKFMSEVKSTIPNTSKILTLPFNIAAYSFISDTDKSGFVGTSPVKLFSGIDDFSGTFSFGVNGKLFEKYLLNRDYVKLKSLLHAYNIDYIFVTKNVSDQVLNSYLFNKNITNKTDQVFYDNLLGKQVINSDKGKYYLYELKDEYKSNLFEIPQTTFYLDPKIASTDNLNNDPEIDNYLNLLTKNQVVLDKKINNYTQNLDAINNDGNSVFSDKGGSYNLSFKDNDIYKLTVKNNQLFLTKNYKLSLNGSVENDLNEKSIFKLTKSIDKYVLGINNNYFDLSDVGNLRLSKYDQVFLFEKENLNLLNSDKLFYSDCQGLNDLQKSIYSTCLIYSNSFEKGVFSFKVKQSTQSIDSFLSLDIEGGVKQLVSGSDNTVFSVEKRINGFTLGFKLPIQFDNSFYDLISLERYNKISDNLLLNFDDLEPKLVLSKGLNSIYLENLYTPRNYNWDIYSCVDKTSIENFKKCLSKSFQISPKSILKISFEYKSTDSKADLKVGFDGQVSSSFDLEKSNDWKKVEESINTPESLSKLNLNLSPNGIYKNFKIEETSLSNEVFLYSTDTIIIPNISNLQKISNDEYNFDVKNISGNFPIHFKDSYSSLWKVKVEKDGKLYNLENYGSQHLRANNFSNYWYIDFDNLCVKNNLCTKNGDKYEIKVKTIFEPLIPDYVGYSITAISFLILLFLAFKDLKFHKYANS